MEVGALISWCIYSYRIVMLLVPDMWASMNFDLLSFKCQMCLLSSVLNLLFVEVQSHLENFKASCPI